MNPDFADLASRLRAEREVLSQAIDHMRTPEGAPRPDLSTQQRALWEASVMRRTVVDERLADLPEHVAAAGGVEQRKDDVDERLGELDAADRRQASAEEAFRQLHATPRVAGRGSRGRDEGFAAFARGEEGHRATFNVDLSEAAEARSLTVGTGSEGGDTAPASFVARLYEHMIETSGVRQAGPTVLTTSGGEDLAVPKTTGHGTAAIVSEGATIGEDDPEFDTVTLGSFKYGSLIKVTNELLTDTSVDLVGYLARSFGRAVGNLSGEHFVSGSGSGEPEGLLGASTLGVTAAATDTVTADEVIDMFFTVIPEYRGRGTWLMTDSMWAKIRKLKDADDNYLVGPIADGGVLRLLGRPVVIDPYVDEPAADAKTILFGDFSAYYIRQVSGLRFERSDDVGFDTDTVWFRVLHRLDGRLVDGSGAIKHLAQAAA
ncbi:MAG: phage major capsid protein [Pseudonocardiaceae bacterium]|nr:phage major capsid protein [Pseudonocardiaceae bacterium]